jgi:hypothetical protein
VPLFIKLEATAHLTSNFAYLLLICLCFLIYPNQQWQPDFGKFTYYIINVPIFFFASVSVLVFYMVSQKALRPGSWWRKSPTCRCCSPRHRHVHQQCQGRHRSALQPPVRLRPHAEIRHRPAKRSRLEKEQLQGDEDAHPFVELLFGFFFLFVVVDAAMRGSWSSAILLLPFPSVSSTPRSPRSPACCHPAAGTPCRKIVNRKTP